MSAAIIMQRAEAIQNHPLKLGRSPKAVASNFLALFDKDLMGQWYLGVMKDYLRNEVLRRARENFILLTANQTSSRIQYMQV